VLSHYERKKWERFMARVNDMEMAVKPVSRDEGAFIGKWVHRLCAGREKCEETSCVFRFVAGLNR